MEKTSKEGGKLNIKQLRERCAQLEDELQQEKKMAAIGRLAGGIAHDFNNMLGSIIGYTEMAAEDLDQDSVVQKSLVEVLSAASRAKDLVQQILSFSRKSESERYPVRIKNLVEEVLRLLRATLPANIELRREIRCAKATVLADSTQIYQVILNLCTNAAQAMGEGGGTLTVEVSTTEWKEDYELGYTILPAGSYVSLAVRDTGQGIPPEVRGKIFEPFFTTKEKGKGTGVGLSAVRDIVLSHNGGLDVESVVGSGSTFFIYLPEIVAESKEVAAAENKPKEGQGHILIVDDETSLANLGKKMLEKVGYEVTAVSESDEALKIFMKQPQYFDLVITDQNMPKMTGLELGREIWHVRPTIPIVVCSGYSDQLSPDNALEFGFCDYLQKPYSLVSLSEKVHQILQGER